jgi:hypothetical protein
MTPIARYTQDPSDELDYTITWSQWLPDGDTVVAATWTVPAGLTEPQASSLTTTTTTVWLAGGTAGADYDVACRITTAEGRVVERTFRLQVRQR